jgi:hypothetical protein
MSGGGLARSRRRAKYRTSFGGRNRRIKFRFNLGAMSLIIGLGLIIANFIRNL